MAIDRMTEDYGEPVFETEADYDGYLCSRNMCINVARHEYRGKDLCDEHYASQVNSEVDYALAK